MSTTTRQPVSSRARSAACDSDADEKWHHQRAGRIPIPKGRICHLLVGGLVLGSVAGAPSVNLAQLVNRADGKIDRLHDPIVTNLARLVQTLDQDESSRTASRSRRSCTN